MEIIIFRKCSSAALIWSVKIRSAWLRALTRLTCSKVEFGKNVAIGRHVKIRTTDGGRIVIGDGVSIDDFSMIYAQLGEIRIGDNGFIGPGTHIVSRESIRIGRDALIAAYCVIRDCNHGMALHEPMTRQPQDCAAIVIGDDVWLGAHAVVTAGTMIGTGAVIGANAVVTRDVAPGAVAAGVPSREIKRRGAEYSRCRAGAGLPTDRP